MTLWHPSRFFAVAVLVSVILLLTNCGRVAHSLINAPSYVGPYTSEANIPYGSGPRQSLDVYKPTSAGKHPIVVFWYGGMWMRGSKAEYRFVGAALANSGYVAVLPDYRLYPQSRFPQFVEDGALAVKWVREHAEQIGGDPESIFLMGHSAGGHIAATLALDPRYLAKVGGGPEWLRGWIGLSAPYILETRIPLLRAMFPPPSVPKDWQTISLVSERSPPALILHGTEDNWVHAQEAVDMDLTLRKAGVHSECRIYEHVNHTGTVTAFSLPFRLDSPALADVTSFIARSMEDPRTARNADFGVPCPVFKPRRDYSVQSGVRVELLSEDAPVAGAPTLN